jgi:hypothetical protein
MNVLMRMKSIGLIAALLLGACAANAQSKAAIEAKLTGIYQLTQPTADLTDIVTAGSVLVLKRGNVMMVPTSVSNPYSNTYKDGKVSQNVLGKLAGFGPPGVQRPNLRTFVPGEKMWVTKIDCKDDGVIFTLFTDAYADVRYKANLKFSFDKKSAMPSADDMSRTVGEVFSVQASDNGAQGGQQQQQQQAPPPQRQQQQQYQAPPAPAPAPMAPIAPPPPPVDQPAPAPKELKVGMTKDELVASYGNPTRVIKMGSKEIYVYSDLKVTLVSGKVTDIQ